ncbi:G patch domain and ankyrin repeat-containing protein 1 homolog [Drosophila sulfurigaster albostrigata]|uniref:G patch domain and ankyrin repeat-containing protein 1 homolog n=1 Tax=Drosophila sulfurigaster albostrigata TaxID=89887 RepID=UPI002D21BF09|nr:G patch domain and ankyrin repeat-containing protein 1 homolog [Drosophila sulfurigaster albostrigata]
MNSNGDELHPNWRALTTLHVPLKRFIRAGAAEEAKQQPEKHKIDGITGDEVHQFYQEVLETPATSRKVTKSPSRPKEPPQFPYDRNRFFRLAQSNNVNELRKMHIAEEAELNACDTYGWTALMMAACEGATDSVAWLLQLGASTEIKDKSGNTALQLAKRKNHVTIVELLQQENSVDATDDAVDDESTAMTTPFYCDLCQRDYKESSWRTHQTSTIHRFNSKSQVAANKLQKFNIPGKNRGLQLMVKQGWDREHGLGPTQSGRLYPVKTVLRKQRTGLGIEQSPARVTHFNAFDTEATRRRSGQQPRHRTRNEMRQEKLQAWRQERRLRHELS